MDESFPLPPRLQAILADLPLAELAFAPVPVRARHDGWTPARQAAFIQRLALGGCVSAAAGAVGKTRASAYRLRERPGAASFAAAWDRALGWGRKRVRDIGLERAILGEAVPVTYRGRRVGTRLRHHNALLIAVLNAFDRGQPPEPRVSDLTHDLRHALAELERANAVTENIGFSRPI